MARTYTRRCPEREAHGFYKQLAAALTPGEPTLIACPVQARAVAQAAYRQGFASVGLRQVKPRQPSAGYLVTIFSP